MTQIQVSASRSYTVTVGTSLLCNISKYLSHVSVGSKVAIISDSNVWPIYGPALEASLKAMGLHACHFVFSAGETSKNGQTYLEILSFLADCQLTRQDNLIALGGGVVGDITGFAAATYLRGIPFVQIPTTLLAMVDSSVGGKTAIDLPAGKNLAGAFYQPSAVLCDLDTLSTLPGDVFIDGCSEVIKYGVLYDPELFAHLDKYGLNFDREWVISRCVKLKRNVVAEDEFDTGARQKLNLGHTFGHGVESCSNYTVTHGKAVAIGMAIAARACAHANICKQEDRDRIMILLQKFSLPVHTEFSAKQLYLAALKDKKRTCNFVNLILPRAIGDCTIQATPVDALEAFIKTGL